MTGFTLRVFIYGLAALIPQGGDREVLLVKADAPGCDRHYAFLVAEAESCDKPADCFINTGEAKNSFEAVYFDLQDIDIDLGLPSRAAGSAPVRMNEFVITDLDLEKPDPAMVSDASWIFPLSDILGLRQDYLDQVTSRMRLAEGDLRTLSLATLRHKKNAESRRAPVFHLDLNGETHRRAVADAAVWERFVPQDKLMVTFKPLHCDDGEPRTIQLTPSACGPTGEQRCIDLFFANIPKRPYPNGGCWDKDGDHHSRHFAMYYQLMDTSKVHPPRARNIPKTSWLSRRRAKKGHPLELLTPQGQPLPRLHHVNDDLKSPDGPSDPDACIIVE